MGDPSKKNIFLSVWPVVTAIIEILLSRYNVPSAKRLFISAYEFIKGVIISFLNIVG